VVEYSRSVNEASWVGLALKNAFLNFKAVLQPLIWWLVSYIN